MTASLVAYNTDPAELSTVLRCLGAGGVDRVWIVDNSPDDSLRRLARHPSIRYVFGQGNVGYGAAHNIAIREALATGTDYHIALNSDIRFPRGAIPSLVAFMEAHGDTGLVMPRIVSPDGEVQHLCRLLPTPFDLILRRFIPFPRLVERCGRRYEMRFTDYDRTMDVPFLSGCFMLLRADVLRLTGGFDDRYWMYCEDIDLSRRVGDIARTVYFPGATVVHHHRKESYRSRRMLWAHIRSAVAYFNRWGWLLDPVRRQRNRAAWAAQNKISYQTARAKTKSTPKSRK